MNPAKIIKRASKDINIRIIWLALIILMLAIVLPKNPPSLMAAPDNSPTRSPAAVPTPSPTPSPTKADNEGTISVLHYWPTALATAKRHNKLENMSDYEFARWIMAMLVIEHGGPTWAKNRLYSNVVSPVWDTVQVTGNDLLSSNASIGIGQVRPETAAQLMQGSIKHEGYMIYHGVLPAYSVKGDGPFGTSSTLLAKPEISIEYMASNMEMGAAVARIFGFKPAIEDMIRWHNTGIGLWDFRFGDVNDGLWNKGSSYVNRVKDAFALLSTTPLNPIGIYPPWNWKEGPPLW